MRRMNGCALHGSLRRVAVMPREGPLAGASCLSVQLRIDRRCGFTIVELLVVISVVAVIIALLVPAVQMSRETARRVQCQNNLRQIGAALQSFVATHRQFPGNGWGYGWVGESGRGSGKAQPGGRIYQLLPYVEQANLWTLGNETDLVARRESLRRLCETPLPVMKCPSRPCPQLGPPSVRWTYRNANPPKHVARTDYAINEGDFITGTPIGPATPADGDNPGYLWTDISKATGVSWLRGGVSFAGIKDGSSNTIAAGEKYVSTLGYLEPMDRGYDQTLYSGVDLDLARWTPETPIEDQELKSERSFGSAHRQACFIALCDGSVRKVSYEISADVFRWLGNRMDGNVVEF